MESGYKNLGAVFILYYPDTDVVLVNIERIKDHAGTIYLIDNTPGVVNLTLEEYAAGGSNIHYIPLRDNFGIAKAQNIGIRKVFEDPEKEYVLLLDQDSEPYNDMITALMDAYVSLNRNNIHGIAAVGPLAINKESKRVYKDRELSKKYLVDAIIKKKEIMSSGSLISKKAVTDVGLMECALFIDGVDSEWCWRAATKGYSSFINEKALLLHKLGEGDKKFLGFRFAITPPIRCFYQYRNFLILIRRSYVPVGWKVLNGIKYLIKLVYYPVFSDKRRSYLNNIIAGIKAGWNYKGA